MENFNVVVYLRDRREIDVYNVTEVEVGTRGIKFLRSDNLVAEFYGEVLGWRRLEVIDYS